jgi:hypothetical protein
MLSQQIQHTFAFLGSRLPSLLDDLRGLDGELFVTPVYDRLVSDLAMLFDELGWYDYSVYVIPSVLRQMLKRKFTLYEVYMVAVSRLLDREKGEHLEAVKYALLLLAWENDQLIDEQGKLFSRYDIYSKSEAKTLRRSNSLFSSLNAELRKMVGRLEYVGMFCVLSSLSSTVKSFYNVGYRTAFFDTEVFSSMYVVMTAFG